MEDILESIKNIGDFTKKLSKERFLKNIEKQHAVVRAIEIIGEATKNIPSSFRTKYATIPWRKIAGMRDVLIHAYFEVRLELVWIVIKKDLPVFKKQMLEILKQEQSKENNR